MATEKPYTILVCDPHADGLDAELAPTVWITYGPLSASSGGQAVEKLWEIRPEMKVNTALLYFPVANFKPKRQRRSFIERWSLDDAELPDQDPPGQTELAT